MFKEVYGFDPEVFSHGAAIKIEDSHVLPERNQFLSVEVADDYFRTNLSGNYLVRDCHVVELLLVNASGEVLSIPLKHINGESPRMKISLLSK